ncbi:MAG: LysR family transcriptional regulator, partial [Propionivibrio sp.]
MDRNLRAFIIVAETGNITAAANLLNITQPTLTKRLQHLEEQYGCKLFERLPRGVGITSCGEALLPYARRVEAEFLQAGEAVNAVKSGHLNDLRIGAGPLFHMRYLGRILRSLHEEFPDTALSLTAGVNMHNLPRLMDGTLDIVFGTTEHLGD